MALDKLDEEWYENQLVMFNEPGWKAFKEQVELMRSAHSSILTVKNADELFKRLGQVDIMTWILNWEESVKQQYEQAQND